VEDRSTAELMVAFHRGLKDGAAPTRALAGAQRVLRAASRHPAYWAPFVVILRPE
jgi:CHAT domain-containing protein